MDSQTFFDLTAYPFIRKEEGGWNPADPSMHGVTQTTYDAYRRDKGMPVQDVRSITDAEVYEIYLQTYYIDGGAASLVDSGYQDLGLAHFNASVNMGKGKAHQILNQAGTDAQAYLSIQADDYRAIAAANPTKHAHDLPVWLARIQRVGSHFVGDVTSAVVQAATGLPVDPGAAGQFIQDNAGPMAGIVIAIVGGLAAWLLLRGRGA